MSDTTIVVDANLVIRRVLFPNDQSVQQAWETWDVQGWTVTAPGLLLYEVTNAIFRYKFQGWLSEETAEVAFSAALALPIQIIGDPALHWQAWVLAFKYKLLSTYDAHYLALAERQAANFYTSDRRLAEAVERGDESYVRYVPPG